MKMEICYENDYKIFYIKTDESLKETQAEDFIYVMENFKKN